MYDKAFTDAFEQSRNFLFPVTRTNKLAVAQLEKLFGFQLSVFQDYAGLAMKQLKSAAEVRNVQDLQDYLSGQIKLVNTLQQKLLDDMQALFDLSAGFKAEYDKLVTDNISELTTRTAEVTKEAAEKAA